MKNAIKTSYIFECIIDFKNFNSFQYKPYDLGISKSLPTGHETVNQN